LTRLPRKRPRGAFNGTTDDAAAAVLSIADRLSWHRLSWKRAIQPRTELYWILAARKLYGIPAARKVYWIPAARKLVLTKIKIDISWCPSRVERLNLLVHFFWL
jgi:hypothetical protein